MTIGLYDIDFNHGKTFSLSLPLMKVYNKLYSERHQVIMMQPYEKTNRYNKIYYFKDSKSLRVPNNLIIDTDKGEVLGYGFLGTSGLKSAAKVPPSFSPYELNSDRIKNKKLFNSIKNNNLVDWREKDFTYTFSGKSKTYIIDRDFLLEEDWKDLFSSFDNNIEFINSLTARNFHQTKEFLKLYSGALHKIVTSPPSSIDELIEYSPFCIYKNSFSIEQIFLIILAAKQQGSYSIDFSWNGTTFENAIIKWGKNKTRESFNIFTKQKFESTKEFNQFPNRVLLKQNPQTLGKTFINENLIFL